MFDTGVVIVGAGPIGLTAALGLARRGVSVQVYESEQTPDRHWRASTFYPPSLEVASELGILDEMLEQGLKVQHYQLRDPQEGVLARFDLDELKDETTWPFRLQLEQYKYSAIVKAALEERSEAEIIQGTAVVGMREHADHVELELDTGESVTAPWVIGADGPESTIRRLAGIDFETVASTSRRLLLSIEEPLDESTPDLDLVNYVLTSDGVGIILRSPDLWRVMFTIPENVPDLQARSGEYFAPRLREVLDIVPEVVSTQVHYIHRNVAASFRRGRMLLVGDAAYANSPTAGIGLNSGLYDVFDLLTVLTEGQEPDLDTWAERRREAAVDCALMASNWSTLDLDQLDQFATDTQEDETHETLVADWSNLDLFEPDPVVPFTRQDAVRALIANPERVKKWLMESSMIAHVRRYSHTAGSKMPSTPGTNTVGTKGDVR